jgi:acyl dehydratase
MTVGEITDEGVEQLRGRVGQVNRKGLYGGYNTEARVDNMRHFVDGIGDMNPLYRDEDFAQEHGYRSLPAHPGFLLSVHPGFVLQGLPGVHALNGGHEWTFVRPVLLGEAVDATSRLAKVEEKQGNWSGRTIFQHDETEFVSGSGDQVAQLRVWNIRGSRSDAKKRGKYEREPYRYTKQQVADITNAYIREEEVPQDRYLEDVTVGDELPGIVRGPLSMSDMIAYYAAAMGGRSHGLVARQLRKHPAWGMTDPKTGLQVEIIRAHEDADLAKDVGFVEPYDVGGQRCSWLISLLTYWAGASGFLRYLYAENRRPVHFGDTVWLGGRVTSVDATSGDVELEVWGMNQTEHNVIPGRAVVSLPRRGGGAPDQLRSVMT